jgi:segregation and condensation protein B
MSLKAKLEAVIYAAEEPVTLAQLALLFTADALQWKAEQDAAAAAQAESAEPGSAPLPLVETDFAYLEADGNAVETELASTPEVAHLAQAAAEPPAETPDQTTVEAGNAPNQGTTSEAAEKPETSAALCQGATSVVPQGPQDNAGALAPDGSPYDSAAASPALVPDPESDLKREARQRDRDVRNILRKLLDELIAEYAAAGRGIEIREVAGGYRMATKPECHDAVRGFVKCLKPPLKLSLPALETLAVIAYKQPVTAPEVNEIRGVDSSGVFGSLLSRKLIATAGRKQVVGRPILYKTTREFLLRFGLKDISELPSMEEFEKFAASELEEPEMAREGESGLEPDGNQQPELDEDASEEPDVNTAASNVNKPRSEAPEATAPATESSAPDAGAKEIEQVPHG